MGGVFTVIFKKTPPPAKDHEIESEKLVKWCCISKIINQLEKYNLIVTNLIIKWKNIDRNIRSVLIKALNFFTYNQVNYNKDNIIKNSSESMDDSPLNSKTNF